MLLLLLLFCCFLFRSCSYRVYSLITSVSLGGSRVNYECKRFRRVERARGAGCGQQRPATNDQKGCRVATHMLVCVDHWRRHAANGARLKRSQPAERDENRDKRRTDGTDAKKHFSNNKTFQIDWNRNRSKVFMSCSCCVCVCVCVGMR